MMLCSMTLGSCEDHLDYPGSAMEEGETTVDVEIAFKAFTPTLESRATGDAMKYIRSLWIVLYDRDGNFIRKMPVTDFKAGLDEEHARPDGQPSGESRTGCAKFKITLDNGYYRMYAIANHDLSGVSDDLISSIDGLKRLDLEWQDGDVKQNAQMFGWFVNGTRDDDHGTDAPVVAISSRYKNLHAWVRRAASKVTIAFDTNNLSEFVNIYVQSVTIKDIPSHCYLAADNSPGSDEYTLDSNLVDGETIYFKGASKDDNPKTDYNHWPCLRSGEHVYGLYSDRNGRDNSTTNISALIAREHDETAPALYFYENLQGIGKIGEITDKRQDTNGDNKQVSYPNGIYADNEAWKDGKPFGSYIEVKGYYVNTGFHVPGHGEITYRFMLGKDHLTDYEAERNHHYKLTMKFNGNANDIDFHIDYKEEARPGFFVQDTTYVSYLYNQTAQTIVRATPLKGYEFVSMESYILDNEWRPHLPNGIKDVDYNESAWTQQANNTNGYLAKLKGYTRPEYVARWTEYGETTPMEDPSAKNTEFGFLSLRKVTQQVFEFGASSADKAAFVNRMRKRYFLGDENADDTDTSMDKSLGYRNYGQMPAGDGTHVMGNETDGTFDISVKTNPMTGFKDYVMEVPLYTRAKSLDSWAVYSGANPFYKHHRMARVRFIAHYRKNDPKVPGPEIYEESAQTIVLQSQRILNPRMIMRRRGNKAPFTVTLSPSKLTAQDQLAIDLATDTVDTVTEVYTPLISDGPWSATIEADPHGIVSIAANGRTVTRQGQSITGRNGSKVEFVYRPLKDPPLGESYGAVILVQYHGNNCSHKIIVRQGYDATEVSNGSKIKWSAFNVYNKDTLTVNPLSVGSTFRRYKDMNQPIAESNNLKYKVHKTPLSNDTFDIIGSTDKPTWSQINANATGSDETFTTMTFYNSDDKTTHNYRLPDHKELPYIGIYTDKNKLPQTDEEEIAHVEDIGVGFGVAYADGATKTLLTNAATGFYDPLNNITDSKMGVRGVVIYSRTTGNNIFFPFGRWGHPRRRRGGMLQYGSVDFLLTGNTNNYRPMAYALKYQVGACYWMTDNANDQYISIDFNGGNYMSSYLPVLDVFQTGSNGSTPGYADALPVKPIRKD